MSRVMSIVRAPLLPIVCWFQVQPSNREAAFVPKSTECYRDVDVILWWEAAFVPKSTECYRDVHLILCWEAALPPLAVSPSTVHRQQQLSMLQFSIAAGFPWESDPNFPWEKFPLGQQSVHKTQKAQKLYFFFFKRTTRTANAQMTHSINRYLMFHAQSTMRSHIRSKQQAFLPQVNTLIHHHMHIPPLRIEDI